MASKTPVISPAGVRASRIVAVLRMASAVFAGAALVGWLLARAFGVSLSPPRWVVPEKREKSASEKRKEQKPDDEKSS